jgi:hypothetical protein
MDNLQFPQRLVAVEPHRRDVGDFGGQHPLIGLRCKRGLADVIREVHLAFDEDWPVETERYSDQLPSQRRTMPDSLREPFPHRDSGDRPIVAGLIDRDAAIL